MRRVDSRRPSRRDFLAKFVVADELGALGPIQHGLDAVIDVAAALGYVEQDKRAKSGRHFDARAPGAVDDDCHVRLLDPGAIFGREVNRGLAAVESALRLPYSVDGRRKRKIDHTLERRREWSINYRYIVHLSREERHDMRLPPERTRRRNALFAKGFGQDRIRDGGKSPDMPVTYSLFAGLGQRGNVLVAAERMNGFRGGVNSSCHRC